MNNSVSKGLLKARMLEYFREVEETGEPLIVTSHGKPTLMVTAIKNGKSRDELFGEFQGRVQYKADIMESTQEEWAEV